MKTVLAIVVLSTPLALAQIGAPATPSFEVVSIRPAKPPTYPGATGGASITWATQPDGYRASNQTIWATIMIAYFPQGIASWTPDRLKGAPSWLTTDQYDINAKVSAADLPAWKAQGSSLESQEMFRAMLQSMLADRCKLVLHRIPNEVPGLVLEVGKGGPLFKATPADETIPTGGMRMPDGGTILSDYEGHTMRFYGVTMERLSWYLSTFSYPRLTVQNHTGLTGKYDFVLHRPVALPGDDNSNSTSSWDLQPLGLKLQQVKVPMDTLVIDHIERPSAN